jgi:hypothetical protein
MAVVIFMFGFHKINAYQGNEHRGFLQTFSGKMHRRTDLERSFAPPATANEQQFAMHATEPGFTFFVSLAGGSPPIFAPSATVLPFALNQQPASLLRG